MMENHNPYDNTVDESRQRSLEKALAILDAQQKEHKQKMAANIKRPNISIAKGMFMFAATVAILLVLLPFALRSCIEQLETRMLVALAASVVVFAAYARSVVVWLVLAYQKLAPDNLRLSCVFEPTCSEYMLLAIEKYGVVHGVGKGVKRLFRCHYPNGGIDNL